MQQKRIQKQGNQQIEFQFSAQFWIDASQTVHLRTQDSEIIVVLALFLYFPLSQKLISI